MNKPNPFLELAERHKPSSVKGCVLAVGRWPSPREQHDDEAQLSAHARPRARHAFANPPGEDSAKLQTLIAELDALTLEILRQLAAFFAGTTDTPPLLPSLSPASRQSIMTLRAKGGLAKLVVEIAAHAQKAHAKTTSLIQRQRTASSHLRDKGEATAICRHIEQENQP